MEIQRKSKLERQNNMKVYISGKIGEEVVSEATRQKFAKAEEMLKAKGYEVFNPCDERWQNTLKREYENDQYVKSPWLTGKFPDFYAYTLLRDLMVLSTKDAVYMLNDYKQSDGARIEYDFALANKKKFLFQEFFHGYEFLESEFVEKVNSGVIEFCLGKSFDKVRADWCVKHIDSVWLPL